MANKAQVLYDFTAEPGNNELTVREGETVTITNQVRAQNSRGDVGLVPEDYIELGKPGGGSAAPLDLSFFDSHTAAPASSTQSQVEVVEPETPDTPAPLSTSPDEVTAGYRDAAPHGARGHAWGPQATRPGPKPSLTPNPALPPSPVSNSPTEEQ